MPSSKQTSTAKDPNPKDDRSVIDKIKDIPRTIAYKREHKKLEKENRKRKEADWKWLREHQELDFGKDSKEAEGQ